MRCENCLKESTRAEKFLDIVLTVRSEFENVKVFECPVNGFLFVLNFSRFTITVLRKRSSIILSPNFFRVTTNTSATIVSPRYYLKV